MLQVLEKTSEEFTRLVDYVKNTHAATHQQYQLEVVDVRTDTLDARCLYRSYL